VKRAVGAPELLLVKVMPSTSTTSACLGLSDVSSMALEELIMVWLLPPLPVLPPAALALAEVLLH
jgi:hypothetical protein